MPSTTPRVDSEPLTLNHTIYSARSLRLIRPSFLLSGFPSDRGAIAAIDYQKKFT